MSAPLNLTAEQMRTIASALDAMSEITKALGISLTPQGRSHLELDDNVLAFDWDDDTKAYAISDRNGD